MPALARLRPAATARHAAVLVALTAAGLTSAGTAPTPASPSAATAAVTSAAAPCLTKGAAERVTAESGLNGSDPNDLTPAQTLDLQSKLQARTAQRQRSLARSGEKTSPSRTIDVYVHVIEKDNGKGGVSTKRIKKQISVLNKAYAGKTSKDSTKTGFTFKLKKIDHTKNSDWYAWSLPDPTVAGSQDDDVEAKTKLHKGGFDDLNLYLASLEDGLLGYATFPQDTTLQQDGVVVLNASLPGGAAKGRNDDGTTSYYNQGDTSVHEVGHWLGLLHTFENGCDAPGDGVADTPAQADGANIFVCKGDDTCPSDPGKDPIHNFMSYGDDKCLSQFTKGQVAVMTQTWDTYRAPVVAS